MENEKAITITEPSERNGLPIAVKIDQRELQRRAEAALEPEESKDAKFFEREPWDYWHMELKIIGNEKGVLTVRIDEQPASYNDGTHYSHTVTVMPSGVMIMGHPAHCGISGFIRIKKSELAEIMQNLDLVRGADQQAMLLRGWTKFMPADGFVPLSARKENAFTLASALRCAARLVELIDSGELDPKTAAQEEEEK